MKTLYLLVPLAPLAGAILAGFFGKILGRTGAHVVTIAGVVNINNNGSLFVSGRIPRQAKVVGIDEISGKPLAWEVGVGRGKALFLGFNWSHGSREQGQMLRNLLSRLGLVPRVECDNQNLWVVLRTSGTRSMLFAMNLLTSNARARIRCRPGWSKGMIDAGEHDVPAMSVKCIPLTTGCRK